MAYFFVVYQPAQGSNGVQVALAIDASLHHYTQCRRLDPGTWLIDSPATIGEVFKAMMALVAPNDCLLVAPTQRPWETNAEPFPQPNVAMSATWADA